MPIGPTELGIVLVIVLVLFGAGRLSEVGGALGRTVRELRDAFKEPVSSRLKTEDSEAKQSQE